MIQKIVVLCCLLLSHLTMQAQQTPACPLLRTSVAADGWVACDNAQVRVQVCNTGDLNASFVGVAVELPSTLTFVSSIPAPSLVSGQLVQYFTGDLAPGGCITIAITCAVSCDAQPGTAICLKASATSSTGCDYPFPGWTGPQLRLDSRCEADTVVFDVLNAGKSLPGGTAGFIITEDHLMRQTGLLPPIDSGSTHTIKWPDPQGKTVTMQIPQLPGHPYPEPISMSVEGCGNGLASTGYVLQYPQHDGNVSADIFCDEVSALISGNQKNGFTVGYGAEHDITRFDNLQYRIRFQNTQSVAVNTLTLTDTLSEWLDLNTFRPGAASYPYTYTLQGQVLKVTFNNLQLPPAAVNPVASRGFFCYHVGVKNSTPSGTVIENTAQVAMNQFAPIQTDTTRHRVGENFILSATTQPEVHPEWSVHILPNPMQNEARVEINGTDVRLPVQMTILDITGRILRRETLIQSWFVIQRAELNSGCYIIQCVDVTGKIRVEKLIVR